MDLKQTCPLCSKEYDSEVCIPKVLNCGHTFCLTCLSDLVIFLKACPSCNESVTQPVSHFPTNFALLEEENPQNFGDLELKKKELGNILYEERQLFDRNFETMKKSEKILNSCMESINKWTDQKIDDPQELNNLIKDMEERLRNLDFTLYSCYKPFIKTDFSLRHIPNKDEFIKKIVVELLRGNKMYAFNSEWYNDDVFWGRLSYQDGNLYIHSLSSELPPVPSLLVPLVDLKNCLDLDNFRPYINIAGNQIVCSMVASSPLSYDFVKLCSGEDGTSFKGLTAKFERSSNSNKWQGKIRLNINIPDNEADQSYDVLDSLPSIPKEISEDNFQIKMWKERCEIINPNISSSKENESDGFVVASAVSSDESFLVLSTGGVCVEDCGLILILTPDQQDTPVEPAPLCKVTSK